MFRGQSISGSVASTLCWRVSNNIQPSGVYFQHTHDRSQDYISLIYTEYFELGEPLEWSMRKKESCLKCCQNWPKLIILFGQTQLPSSLGVVKNGLRGKNNATNSWPLPLCSILCPSVRSSDFRIQQLKLNLNLVLLSIGTCKKLLSTVPGINCYQDLDPMM